MSEGTKEDIVTGTTPRKRQWEYMDQWQLTKDREDVLREWRAKPFQAIPLQAEYQFKASIETVPEVPEDKSGFMELDHMVTETRPEETGQENIPVQRLDSPDSSPLSLSSLSCPTETTVDTANSIHAPTPPPVLLPLAPTQTTSRPTSLRPRTTSTSGLPKVAKSGKAVDSGSRNAQSSGPVERTSLLPARTRRIR
jgi:kinesin family member 11